MTNVSISSQQDTITTIFYPHSRTPSPLYLYPHSRTPSPLYLYPHSRTPSSLYLYPHSRTLSLLYISSQQDTITYVCLSSQQHTITYICLSSQQDTITSTSIPAGVHHRNRTYLYKCLQKAAAYITAVNGGYFPMMVFPCEKNAAPTCP